MTDIYGIDPDGKVTPKDVRNALFECFLFAHGDDLAASLNIDLTDDKDGRIKKEGIDTFLKGVFDTVKGDFNEPTKEELMRVIDYLVKFSKNFRDSKIIEKHAGEIMTLINKLS
jgi:hypothetical protein